MTLANLGITSFCTAALIAENGNGVVTSTPLPPTLIATFGAVTMTRMLWRASSSACFARFLKPSASPCTSWKSRSATSRAAWASFREAWSWLRSSPASLSFSKDARAELFASARFNLNSSTSAARALLRTAPASAASARASAAAADAACARRRSDSAVEASAKARRSLTLASAAANASRARCTSSKCTCASLRACRSCSPKALVWVSSSAALRRASSRCFTAVASVSFASVAERLAAAT
mmetsp:Transcript_118700/g.253349  ORF Transcript_118700/g.253349 Transcript_118700/m.253349 type:complete len:239 (-) Transcript_118700:1227-1943(-)